MRYVEIITERTNAMIIRESIGSFTVRVVSDDSREIPSGNAAIFRRPSKEIIIRQRYASNQHIMNHEIGHALFDHVQPITIIDAFQHDPAAWADFLQTSTARSYQKHHDHQSDEERNNPQFYDWVEAIADLWMEYKAGRFEHLPDLVRFLHQLMDTL